ncbi:hypothetical protein RSA46_21055 [Pseudomonas oryzihabitans]|nr:hypothetical protein RSA46_21055 [Pseudomonas psychrotolerans]
MPIDKDVLSRIASVTLGHVVQEFPHSQARVYSSTEDFARPRLVHPIFFGSFDWHSCVHGYWLLVCMLDFDLEHAQRQGIVELLDRQLTPDKVAKELEFFARPDQTGFERPYGWAWLLMLTAKLQTSNHTRAPAWLVNLRPLAQHLRDKTIGYFIKLPRPLRSGLHGNTAFAMVLALTYAKAVGDEQLATFLIGRAHAYFPDPMPVAVNEPDGEDFLSPVWQQLLLMQHALDEQQFESRVGKYLHCIDSPQWSELITPVITVDQTDGRLAHWDGLNLSRAWCMASIARSLPSDCLYRARLERAATDHLAAGSAHLHEHYMGEHWLATFLLLACTELREFQELH